MVARLRSVLDRRGARGATADRGGLTSGAAGGAGGAGAAGAEPVVASPRVALLNSSRVSVDALRNSRIALPIPAPTSGSLPGPQMIRTITRTMAMIHQ